MNKGFTLIGMIFCHIIDDYYLQGWLASAKQKSWWEKNAPNPLYKKDYLMALFMHCFSWTCMVMLIPIIYLNSYGISDNVASQIILVFVINLIVHYVTDNAKANMLTINLIEDQMIHIIQIVCTWLYLIVIR